LFWSAGTAPAARYQLDAHRPADAPFVPHVHVPFCARRCDSCYYLFAEPLRELAGRGGLTTDRDAVALARDGLLRADRLLADFYLPEHRGVRYS
jgi:hypothetical protein